MATFGAAVECLPARRADRVVLGMFPQQWSVSPRAQRTRHKHEHLKKGAATGKGKGCENTMENTPSMVTSLFLAAETAPVIEQWMT